MTTVSTPALGTVRGDADPRAELTRLLFAGSYERVHADIRAALLDPVFDPREGLSLPEAGRLAYERSRHIHGRLERPREILRDPRRLFALAEWPSLLDVSTFSLLMVHYNLCFGTVFDHGIDRADIADYVEELDSLSSFGPYMATELGYGNNVAAMRTEAVYDRATDTFVLHTPDALAQKYMSYSGFNDIPKIAVVLARLQADGTDHGVFPFLVELCDERGPRPGVHTAPCPEKPVQGLDNGLTWFDQMRLPRRSLLLGDMGEFLADGTFRTVGGNHRKRFLRTMSRIMPGRLCVSSSAVGAGRASVYIALRYAQQRRTNAPGRNDLPVLEYRSHQLALFTALARTYAMTFLLNHAKHEYVTSSGGNDLNVLISVTKTLSTWEMTEVVAVCRERCGAQGIFSANRIADYGSLLQGLVTAEGDNQVLLATTAGQLLAQRGHEPDNPAPPPGAYSLLDPRLHIAALSHRERLLHGQARAVLDEASGSYLEAWNQVLNTALAMARTRGVRIAVERFHVAAEGAATEDARTALHTLARLYGLTELQRDAGWYLARGLLTAEQVLAVPGELDSLCVALLPYVTPLIDGFQLSPELLRAPIAADDYVSAFQAVAGANPGGR
ncbi:acyl-CoA dehydrogenase [Amycolatopsis cihanbeyliensis]|uniref:Acyl-coenzyme A oxidase n=1 Tax=Amycolatopsis cihanbeyliensis TaxID=1128664 RepID=A0A542DBJ8_AMYCI|nr:acyl-CoA dehydrogenase [Amycolatopsis cihanbeyliensis]TQJ00450.1 acyl-coenzyme A oxidase [Amycolatopsis cihanbeyliensis]